MKNKYILCKNERFKYNTLAILSHAYAMFILQNKLRIRFMSAPKHYAPAKNVASHYLGWLNIASYEQKRFYRTAQLQTFLSKKE